MQSYSSPKKMKKVGDLFDKYKLHFKAPQSTVEKACSEAILEITGIKISPDNIIYKVETKTLNLQVSSLLKSELNIYQKEIINKLKKELGERESPNIFL